MNNSKYFVTVIRVGLKEDRPYVEDIRCWGYLDLESVARRAVEEDWTFMWEDGYYDLAVIEAIPSGLVPHATEIAWYRNELVDQATKFFKATECEKPKWLDKIVMFALG